jgi:hypothetical protein
MDFNMIEMNGDEATRIVSFIILGSFDRCFMMGLGGVKMRIYEDFSKFKSNLQVLIRF